MSLRSAKSHVEATKRVRVPLRVQFQLVVAFVVASLVFLPADAVGPIVEQLLMARGGTF